jgi:2-polyprenyl-3-methyl-5-hydroxy-6-metoxy-1,4-benzoquinol methylase
MTTNCSICGGTAAGRPGTARSGKALTIYRCEPCRFDFLAHDPTKDLAANKLDETRLKAAGLDIPTVERDFANGIAQSRPYIEEYLGPSDAGGNVLEVGCSWGYFLALARDAGMKPYGVELNPIRAGYVSEQLQIPCDTSLEACEARGVRFRKICLFYVLEYVPDPVAYLQRLVNMLEDGGSLVVITPNLDDAIKDLWRNEAFQRFFYDEHAINYMTYRTVERLAERLQKRDATITSRQGYSFVNHVSWFLTNAPRTTGVVGGDNFIRDILLRLRPGADADAPEWDDGQRALARRLADLIARFDTEYRKALEHQRYGNQVRLVARK